MGLILMWKGGTPQMGLPSGIKAASAPCTVWKHWKRDCPQGCRSEFQDNQDWRCLGVPTQAPVLITPEEPQVLITARGQSVNFLLDTGVNYSMLTEAPGPLSSQSTSVMGLSGQTKRYYVSCDWDSVLFHTHFWSCQSLPHPIWGGIYWARSMPLFS